MKFLGQDAIGADFDSLAHMISTGLLVLGSLTVSAVRFRFRGVTLDPLYEKYKFSDAISN
jgi:hypothetical protein